MLAMMEAGILSPEKLGNYWLGTGIRKINVAAKDLEYGIERVPLFFTKEDYANQVIKFYKTNNQKVIVKRSRSRRQH